MKGSQRILLVEDDVAIGELCEEILTNFGYKVEAVSTITEARKILFKNEPLINVVISDMNLPDGDGCVVFCTAKGRRPRPKLIAMSGDDQKLEEARKVGCTKLLQKPFRLADLVKAVEELIRGE